jgi:hypothetical protein
LNDASFASSPAIARGNVDEYFDVRDFSPTDQAKTKPRVTATIRPATHFFHIGLNLLGRMGMLIAFFQHSYVRVT